MIWLWILGILTALILLLCCTRVGVHVAFGGSDLTLDVKVGLFRFRVLPAKKKKKTAEKQEVQKTIAKKPQKQKKASVPKPSLADIKDAVHTLVPPLKRALGRTRRRIRIHPLQVRMTVGGREDPAAAAELYGYLHAGVWTAMPVLEGLLVIPDPYVHIGLDFDAAELAVDGKLGISARIGTLLIAALGIGVPVLRWFLRYQKKYKNQKPAQTPEHAAA